MGIEDIKRQRVNVEKMQMLGAEIKPVTRGKGTLKEATDEAFEYLLNHKDVFYLIGSAVGPAPYPKMVKAFQRTIGDEAKKQLLKHTKICSNHTFICTCVWICVPSFKRGDAEEGKIILRLH